MTNDTTINVAQIEDHGEIGDLMGLLAQTSQATQAVLVTVTMALTERDKAVAERAEYLGCVHHDTEALRVAVSIMRPRFEGMRDKADRELRHLGLAMLQELTWVECAMTCATEIAKYVREEQGIEPVHITSNIDTETSN